MSENRRTSAVPPADEPRVGQPGVPTSVSEALARIRAAIEPGKPSRGFLEHAIVAHSQYDARETARHILVLRSALDEAVKALEEVRLSNQGTRPQARKRRKGAEATLVRIASKLEGKP